LVYGRNCKGLAAIGGEEIVPKVKAKENTDIATKNFDAGCKIVETHPVFRHLFGNAYLVRDKSSVYRKDGLASVTNEGVIFCNPTCRIEPWEWARAIAHCLLHLAMGHFQKKECPTDWNIACDFIVEKFLSNVNFGKPLYQNSAPAGYSDEEKLYRLLGEVKDKTRFTGYGTAGVDISDMLFGYKNRFQNYYYRYNKQSDKISQ
jgi:hypothetical protein